MPHTKGEWKVDEHDSGVVIDSKGKDVACMSIGCCMGRNDYDRDILHANARLIASAPDLLEACKDIVDHIETLSKYGTTMNIDLYRKTQILEPLRQAINKATAK